MVHLVKTLQSDAIQLGYRVHALAGSYNVRSTTVLLLGTLLLLFQIHHVALGKHILLVALVIACQLASRNARFASQFLKCVARLGYYIIVLVVELHDM